MVLPRPLIWGFIVDIDMDPLIEDLKSDLRFVLEKIPLHDGVIQVP